MPRAGVVRPHPVPRDGGRSARRGVGGELRPHSEAERVGPQAGVFGDARAREGLRRGEDEEGAAAHRARAEEERGRARAGERDAEHGGDRLRLAEVQDARGTVVHDHEHGLGERVLPLPAEGGGLPRVEADVLGVEGI